MRRKILPSRDPNPKDKVFKDKPVSEDLRYVSLLKTHARTKDMHEGSKLYSEIRKQRLLEKNPYIASTVISMYSKFGALERAREVLEELILRNAVSWNALIAGYVEQGQGHEALDCFEQMQNEGLSPNVVTYICTLKACSCIRAIQEGMKIHADVTRRGLLEINVALSSTLIDMYSKCGCFTEAHEVLDEIPIRNIVSWNALISGYVLHNQCDKVLNCIEQIQSEGFLPTDITFICILKVYGDASDIEKGKEVHSSIEKRGLLNVVLGTTLVNMYANCVALVEAQDIADKLPFRNIILWSALIAGYAKQEQYHESLGCFKQMENEGLSPNIVIMTCILKVCARLKAMEKGQQIYDEIIYKGLLKKDIMLGNAVVDMYSQFGMLKTAEDVLEELPIRDAASWSALIGGYNREGRHYHTLNSFDCMRIEGLSPDAATLANALRACGNIGALDKGERIHEEIEKKGFLQKDTILGTTLIFMYAECGVLSKAQNVFETLLVRDTISLNALMAGYIQHGKDNEALNCFEWMLTENLSPDKVTFICVLQACGNARDLETGKRTHTEIVNRDLMGKDIALDTALVSMYVKCGASTRAQEVLEEIPVRNEISWNALISGCVQHGLYEKAFYCFEQMQWEGITPSASTFISISKACGCAGVIDKGAQIHGNIVNRGLLEKDIMLGTTLVDMFAKCGDLSKAQQVLEGLPARNTVSWSALIAGYVQQGYSCEALDHYEQMQRESLNPSVITLICVLKACGRVGAIGIGRKVHHLIGTSGPLEDTALGNALVGMYARCGMLAKSQQVLEELDVRDVVSWNTLIAGYARARQCGKVLDCLHLMCMDGLDPDEVTYLSVFCASGPLGVLEEAGMVFGIRNRGYGIVAPSFEHYAFMVALLGSAGLFEEAISVMKSMPSSTTTVHGHVASGWLALLDACRKWGNVWVGKFAFSKVIEMIH